MHRHEPPVPYYPISIIGSTDEVFAVNKPPSLPVHACGAFRYNTLEMIIRKELTNEDFFFVHRLDRVTSGVLLIAKKKEMASSISAELQRGGCHKVYLAIVEGEFTPPQREGIVVISDKGIAVDRNIATVSQKEGMMKTDALEGKVRKNDYVNISMHIHISSHYTIQEPIIKHLFNVFLLQEEHIKSVFICSIVVFLLMMISNTTLIL